MTPRGWLSAGAGPRACIVRPLRPVWWHDGCRLGTSWLPLVSVCVGGGIWNFVNLQPSAGAVDITVGWLSAARPTSHYGLPPVGLAVRDPPCTFG